MDGNLIANTYAFAALTFTVMSAIQETTPVVAAEAPVAEVAKTEEVAAVEAPVEAAKEAEVAKPAEEAAAIAPVEEEAKAAEEAAPATPVSITSESEYMSKITDNASILIIAVQEGEASIDHQQDFGHVQQEG